MRRRSRLLFAFAIPLGVLVVIGVVLFLVSRVLLSVSEEAAPVVALALALLVFLGGALIAIRPNLPAMAVAGLAAAFFVALAVGGTAAWFSGEREITLEEEAAAVEIVAENIEFAQEDLVAPAGEEFAIEFTNLDDGVPHNVAIYTDETATQALFVGEIFNGVETETYEIDPLDPGQYFFRCDVHPVQMTGTITIGEDVEPTGAEAAEIAAENIAFDTEQLTLEASTEVTLAFDNNDEVPHNWAMYASETASDPIFIGEIINEGDITYTFMTPEPGKYFFRCDVHPQQMTGTVVVE